MQKTLAYLALLWAAMLVSCSSDSNKYRIGVSQCSADIWRDKQNAELKMGAYFHDNVELCFAAAYDSDERQVQQIDSLLSMGIDLLIVAPNQVATISPAIDRAYDKGIPVIVFERKTNSQKYTAYMGADNYEMGKMMGEYIASRLQGKGRVMEVMGLKGSSPAIERHKGFREAMAAYPKVEIVATLQGDWTEPTAYKMVKEWLSKNADTPIDLVFGMNDRSAMGARKAFLETQTPTPLFCGIDGLPGENGGIQQVRDSLLDASYIYPTHGDQLLQLAVDILDGKPYPKETALMSAIVTPANAHVLLMESKEIIRQSRELELLHHKASDYMEQLAAQRLVNILTISLALLLLLLVIGIWMLFRQRTRIQRERTEMEREQLDFYTQVSHELRTPLTLIEGPLTQLAERPDIQQASAETSRIFAIVRRNTHQLTSLINKMLDVQVKGTRWQAIPVEDAPLTASIDPISSPLDDTPSSQQDPEEMPTVLIVDDNADIRTYLHTILQGQYQLFEAADGKEGLAVAREQVPDLIISDVMMPVMNGLEFCLHVKTDEVTSHIPVILLTARALNRHQIEGYESGADAYITKPFQPDLLLARITNLLRSRHLLKDLWSIPQGGSDGSTESHTDIPSSDDEETTRRTTDPSPQLSAQGMAFITRFKTVVEERMGNSELSVEDIGSDMGLSRVQLYRKVKALTGSSPVDLLRKARLVRAKQLLLTTDLSVSEVAYKVGFTSPSYFSKCFKDEYGMVPGDARKL